MSRFRTTLLLLCCSLALGHALQTSQFPDLSEFKRGLKTNAQRCASVYNVQYLQILGLMEAPIVAGYDRNAKCFICCMLEGYQMLTSDGEFLDGNMRKLSVDLPESEMKNMAVQFLDTCLREDNEDICEKCYQFAKCYYDHSKTIKSEGVQPGNQQLLSNKAFDRVGKIVLQQRPVQSSGRWAKAHFAINGMLI